jgi:hypothetical protein
MGHKGPEGEWRNSSTLYLTSVPDGWVVSGTSRPLYLWEMARYPFCSSLGEPQGRSGGERKISPPPEFDPRTVQPVASSYTDCAIPAPYLQGTQWKQDVRRNQFTVPYCTVSAPEGCNLDFDSRFGRTLRHATLWFVDYRIIRKTVLRFSKTLVTRLHWIIKQNSIT